MGILQTFGINWYLVIAQIVNFLIILYLLKKYAYKPILGVLKKREELIHKGLADAKKGEEALQEADEERKKIIKQARDEAHSIVDNARKEASMLLEEAQIKAKKQTEIMLKDGEEAIKREAHMAEEKIEKNIGKIVEEVVKKSLKDILSADQQKEILQNTMKYIAKNK